MMLDLFLRLYYLIARHKTNKTKNEYAVGAILQSSNTLYVHRIVFFSFFSIQQTVKPLTVLLVYTIELIN